VQPAGQGPAAVSEAERAVTEVARPSARCGSSEERHRSHPWRPDLGDDVPGGIQQ
jgi:hypothetical protein